VELNNAIQNKESEHAGIFEKVFFFLTHNDSREHVLHHTMTKNYLRTFPNTVPLQENAV